MTLRLFCILPANCLANYRQLHAKLLPPADSREVGRLTHISACIMATSFCALILRQKDGGENGPDGMIAAIYADRRIVLSS